jgi:hypothetical protein
LARRVSFFRTWRARKGDRYERVTGQDGKSYRATRPQTQANADEPPDLIAQANKHLASIIPLLRQMPQPERLNFRRTALQQMADGMDDL